MAARQAGIRPAALALRARSGARGRSKTRAAPEIKTAPSRLGLGGGGGRRKWHGRRQARRAEGREGQRLAPGGRADEGEGDGGQVCSRQVSRRFRRGGVCAWRRGPATPATAADASVRVGVGSGERLRLRHPAARAGAGRAACCRRRGAGTGPGVGDSISKQPTAALPSQLCADGARTGTGEARPR